MRKPRTEKFDITYFQDYVATYHERYPDDQNIMFLDMLYGIGICIDKEKFKGGDGFQRFIDWIAEAGEFEKSRERYQKALTSLVSEESSDIEWNEKLNRAFQIAAFGKVIDYKPEDHPDEDQFDTGWLANRNHG
jgi:hypothetical protein